MWTALYDDNTSLDEIDKDIVNKFSDINQHKLVEFIASNGHSQAVVNLHNGTINVNGTELEFGFEDCSYRLIYFKRVRKEFSQTGGLLNGKKSYFVGWQTTIDNKNHKRMVELDEDRVIIHSE